ncbi:PDZ domain-containing protein [Aliiglaciecola sp. 3_MG-2023]|uniref:PDZ domain-containing protein n=1 Tax=Aliiglaciecola sp. 3_MG-2023 TaxID=3062644 RepID=UPI0026E34FD0|nr:PDZ domain-containing protein [Aliiglaciecola sp. 3_MG-2023]MDO6693125.1 PDZ domain-containing protein [Aliiglaciecola sp. 3_MG-2023]
MRLVLLAVFALLVGCSANIDEQSTKATEIERTAQLLKVGENAPFKNLQSALLEAKQQLNNNQAVTIELAEGKYYLDSTLILGSEFSGTEQFPFVIKGAAGKKVVISGGKPLMLNWQPYDDNIYQAKVNQGEFSSLFLEGKRQPLARYPNFDSEVVIFNGYAADAVSPERVVTWTNPEGGYVHALHEARWGDMHYLITGVNPDHSLELEGGYQNNRRSPMHLKYRFVENIFSELDTPGEWFLDKKTQTVYFYPPQGTDIHSANIEVSHLDNLIEMRGTENNPVKNIQIQGIKFQHTQPTFMQTKEPLLRSDWAIYRGGAVIIDGAENVSLKDSEFHMLGGNAIFISNYNRNIIISGNHIHDIGASAVSFVGSPKAVRSPSFEYHEFVPEAELDFEVGPKTNDYPSQSLVYNNLIHDIGLVEKQVVGVQLSMAADITVSHNSIYRVPRAGINVSEGTWGGHIIEFNDVFDTVLETGDHGAFNSWGRDRFWHPDRAEMDRLAAKYPQMFLLDAIRPTILRNNRFQCDHGWDIDLDDGSSNYQITNNLMLSGGLKLREGFKRIATNNIILNNSFHPHVWFEGSQDVVEHNILLSGHKPILNNHWGTSVNHNFFVNESDLQAAQALGLDEQSNYGDPQFVNPEQGNYQVKESSAALAVGFKNFPMDQFGVMTPELKALAEQPAIRPLYLNSTQGQSGQKYALLGATLKSVETLGEQSALGISDIAGAMVLSVDKGSKMDLSGLQTGDVVLQVLDTQFGGADEIISAADLLASYQSRKWRGVLEVVISRNQQQQTISINLID